MVVTNLVGGHLGCAIRARNRTDEHWAGLAGGAADADRPVGMLTVVYVDGRAAPSHRQRLQ